MARPDPVLLEVMKNLYASVPEEMGAALVRSAFSPNITERRDCSCALFDGDGTMIAQAAHVPVHLGSTPLSVQVAIAEIDFEPGDVVILNDPFRGGTHLPDVTAISAVYLGADKRPSYYVANRAHHADIGGMSPGSMSPSTEIFQEGLRLPPVKLYRRGEPQRDVHEMILANVRTPEERLGDLTAQVAANRTGEARLEELVERYGKRVADRYARELVAYTARRMRRALADLPNGTYTFEDALDDDGVGDEPVKIRVAITLRNGRATVDFTGTDPQGRGNLNANLAITVSAVFYVFRTLLDADMPSNAGCLEPIEVIAPEGTVVHASFPAAVAGGNVETSQRIVDVLYGALAQAAPDRIPAASAGSMNNLIVGGYDPIRERYFTYYETIAGGMGARPSRDGLSAVHTHMTNTRNTPIEALESVAPLRVTRYEVRQRSGGSGKHRGGDGVIREIEALAPVELSLLLERRKRAPYGLAGGEPGTPGKDTITSHGKRRRVPAKIRRQLETGERITLETPGGGGHGKPERPR